MTAANAARYSLDPFPVAMRERVESILGLETLKADGAVFRSALKSHRFNDAEQNCAKALRRLLLSPAYAAASRSKKKQSVAQQQQTAEQLAAANAELRARIAMLENRVVELDARLADALRGVEGRP